ncbi:MAG: NADH-quinone oxidoreductase subunit NuoB, partial [Actinobacteria bacterium]|nr:NADH-quinone oxidoreductase subunit NuoB [Actinomycetota bacterium]
VAVVVDGQPVQLWAVEAGLACCGVEYAAATTLVSQLQAQTLVDLDAFATSDSANVLVVSGTVTTALAPYVVALYQRMGPGARVMSFGACAATGGPYWDSYAVVDGVDRLVPVDVYVPGCPPSPEALIDGLRTLLLDVRA